MGVNMDSSLLELALEPTPQKRRELMGNIATMFVEGVEKHSDEELSLFRDVLTKLLDKVDVDGKAALAETLADVRQSPPDITNCLADDVAEVASPILERSQVLSEDDLIHLARKKGQEHLLAISKREELAPQLTDVLLERGEHPVRRSVADNPGARLSDWGSRVLIKLGEKDPAIRESLCLRPDTTPETIERFFTSLPADNREKLQALIARDETIAKGLISEVSRTVAGVRLEQKKGQTPRRVLLSEIRSGERNLDQVIIEHAISNKLAELSYVFAELSSLKEKYVCNAMEHIETASLSIVCKALDVGEPAYASLCKARSRHLKLPMTVTDAWASDYRVLSVDEAQRVLRFVKARLALLEKDVAA